MTRLPALLVLALLGGATNAGAAELVHGADAAFAGRGVVILWAVLRGADESAATVIIRVVRTDPEPGALAVDGVDPFTRRREVLLPPTPLDATRDLRVPRARFADYPRTEIHLALRPDDLAAGRAALTIYFTGVPDTTPELGAETALETYFAGALARVRRR